MGLLRDEWPGGWVPRTIRRQTQDGAVMFRSASRWVSTRHPNDDQREAEMADGKMEEMKGKAKEKIGEIRNDDEQRNEGRAEQASGKFDQAKDKIGDAVGDIKDAFRK
jgi:uncharacterized protein YjbJ (UPF0337 family)